MIIDNLNINQFPKGKQTRAELKMVQNGLGQIISIPIIIIRGADDGPVLGITSGVHGNELNGLPVIHNLIKEVEPEQLKGTIIAIPIVNIPGYFNFSRYFNDGSDLNRIMPGNPKGSCGQIYAHRFLNRAVYYFDYLLDLHTASFGRINSLYIRADLVHETTEWMAQVQNAEILLHNCGGDGTLRSAAMMKNISAITIEVGDPQTFQQEMIDSGLIGTKNVISRLKMYPFTEVKNEEEPIICVRSYWLYTDTGGVLHVQKQLRDFVKKGEKIAYVTNIYGDVIAEYTAPEDGVVIGKAINPANQTGSRILHLGIVGTKDDMGACPAWTIQR